MRSPVSRSDAPQLLQNFVPLALCLPTILRPVRSSSSPNEFSRKTGLGKGGKERR